MKIANLILVMVAGGVIGWNYPDAKATLITAVGIVCAYIGGYLRAKITERKMFEYNKNRQN